jgi:hypothetical protein
MNDSIDRDNPDTLLFKRSLLFQWYLRMDGVMISLVAPSLLTPEYVWPCAWKQEGTRRKTYENHKNLKREQ